MRINLWGLVIGIVVLIGLFGPWITKGLDPYGVKNPKTGLGELHYRRRILLSPFYAVIIEESFIPKIMWFPSRGTVTSGLMLFSASILSAFKFKRNWANLVIFIMAFSGVVLFFMSLGTGLGVGLKTNFGWGLIATLLGVVSMMVSSIIQIIK